MLAREVLNFLRMPEFLLSKPRGAKMMLGSKYFEQSCALFFHCIIEVFAAFVCQLGVVLKKSHSIRVFFNALFNTYDTGR